MVLLERTSYSLIQRLFDYSMISYESIDTDLFELAGALES